MSISEILAVSAALTHVLGYLVYNKQILTGKNRPNTTTWMIWALISFLNVWSYWTMSGDWAKSLVPMAGSMMCVLTFFVLLGWGKFIRPDKYDLLALLMGTVAALAWWYFRSAVYGNLLGQGCLMIGFFPTYRGVWKNPKNEKILPWVIWTFGYVLGLTVVVTRWQNQYQDLVYYVVCVVLHPGVAILALRKEKRD